MLHHRENATHGQFAFTTKESGQYLACFSMMKSNNTGGGSVSINVDWRTGIAAKDWDSVARKEKLEVRPSNKASSCCMLCFNDHTGKSALA